MYLPNKTSVPRVRHADLVHAVSQPLPQTSLHEDCNAHWWNITSRCKKHVCSQDELACPLPHGNVETLPPISSCEDFNIESLEPRRTTCTPISGKMAVCAPHQERRTNTSLTVASSSARFGKTPRNSEQNPMCQANHAASHPPARAKSKS